jgi:hypothetical protein
LFGSEETRSEPKEQVATENYSEKLLYLYVDFETARWIFINDSFIVEFTERKKPFSYQWNNRIFLTQRKLDIALDEKCVVIEVKVVTGINIPCWFVDEYTQLREGSLLLDCRDTDLGAFVYDLPFICLNKVYFRSTNAQLNLEKPSPDLWTPKEKYAITAEGEFCEAISLLNNQLDRLDCERSQCNHRNQPEDVTKRRRKYEAGLCLREKRDGQHLHSTKVEYEKLESKLSNHTTTETQCQYSGLYGRIKELLINSNYVPEDKEKNIELFKDMHDKLRDSSSSDDDVSLGIEILDENLSTLGGALFKKPSYEDIGPLPLQGLYVLEKTYENFDLLGKFFDKKNQSKLEQLSYYYFGLFRGISTVPSSGIKEDFLLQFLVEQKAANEFKHEALYRIEIDLDTYVSVYDISWPIEELPPVTQNRPTSNILAETERSFKQIAKISRILESNPGLLANVKLIAKISRILESDPRLLAELYRLLESNSKIRQLIKDKRDAPR